MEIPEDISKVGWYQHGAAPGSNGGSTLFVSHRDGIGPEPGAFYKIETLNRGDKVFVYTNNYIVIYLINNNFSIKKSNLSKKSQILFDENGPPKLVMVTCGGSFDFKNNEYRKNIIVIATPISIIYK